MVEFKLDSDPLDQAQNYEIPDLSTASLSQYYPEIKNDWTLGSQAVTESGQIYSRIFNQLEFLPEPVFTYNEIPLNRYDDFYEGDHYLLLTNEFLEHTYSSSVDLEDPTRDFIRWQKTSTRIRQEVRYSPKKIRTVEWVRSSPDLNGVFSSVTDGQVIAPLNISAPYTFEVNTGQAIKAKVSFEPNDAEIEVRLKSADGLETVLIEDLDNIVLTLPIIEVTVLKLSIYTQDFIGILNPRYIKFKFYGEEKLRTYIPSFSSGEPEINLYPLNTPLAGRLKPPGLPAIQDNFWNSNPEQIELKNFGTRTDSIVLMP